MFEGVLKSSCEIVKYGWTKDPHKGLPANIRKQNDCAEECMPQGAPFETMLLPGCLHLRIIRLIQHFTREWWNTTAIQRQVESMHSSSSAFTLR
ncbi:hypothetical protein M8C21_031349, partial [Ambrosia artemisiifolia]